MGIHGEMRAWRKHLKNNRFTECISCKLFHDNKGHLCSDCVLMESENS
jgi:hypothetical protein